jgi:23S rRNA (cytidine2498-2'-O)-methyltransferase
MPKAGDRVLDLGSSPGGWTWVLDQLGCEVISVDKAPLSNDVSWSSKVQYIDNSAFALEPSEIGKVDWLFSDIICYPERLLKLAEKWESFAKNMVCTLKFQGPSDYLITKEFLKMGKSHIRHLSVNKHELTWIKY